jgi:putative phosphoribosyl transferase
MNQYSQYDHSPALYAAIRDYAPVADLASVAPPLPRPFKSRADAGRRLARALHAYEFDPDVVVVAPPRGGLPVAYAVARALHVPLDICIVRNLCVPGAAHLAMGAIATDDVCVMNPDVLEERRLSREIFDEVADAERRELHRRQHAYLAGHEPVALDGRTVILVDDGAATGATLRAATAVVRQRRAATLIVAVPVCPITTCQGLRAQADEVHCLLRPESPVDIRECYDDFPELDDDEVRRLLRRADAIPAIN